MLGFDAFVQDFLMFPLLFEFVFEMDDFLVEGRNLLVEFFFLLVNVHVSFYFGLLFKGFYFEIELVYPAILFF